MGIDRNKAAINSLGAEEGFYSRPKYTETQPISSGGHDKPTSRILKKFIQLKSSRSSNHENRNKK